MSLLKVNEIQIFNGTTVTITATTTETSADLNVGADLDVTGALTLGTALAIAEGGTGATDAATARTNLDVDQAGTDNSTNVTLAGSLDYITISGQEITRNAIDLTTDVTGALPIANGGTGSTTAANARTALGLAIGSDVQAYDADTVKYDDTTANFTGTLQNGGSNVVVDSDIGSTVQAYDAGLTSIAGLTTAANKIIYTTASDTYAVTDLTAAGRAILDDADAAAQRTTLGLGTAATTASTDYATAAQGSLADSAVQPGDDADTLGSGAATDGYVLTADGAGNAAWEAASGGGASLPIDLLSSGASIRKSDGTTTVLSESGGAVTLENTSLGDTVLMPDNSNNVSTAPGIRFEADTDTGIGLASAGNLAIVTGGTERMRIASSGNLLVGKTAEGITGAADGIQFNYTGGGSFSVTSDAALYLSRRSTTGTIVQFRSDTTNVGSISVTASSTAYNTSSDYRLKTDLQPMTGATDRLKALNPVNFEWIADGTRVDGFLAHEAQEVVPEAVTGTKDAVDADGNPEYQGIDQAKLVPLLTAALQETLALVEAQSAKIDALETRIQALEV